MFGMKKSELENKIADQKRELKRLEKDAEAARKELETFKHKKKLEEEDIKHMRRIEMEKLKQEAITKEIEMERKKDKEIAVVRNEYRDKLEKRLQTEVDNMKGMYNQILERLPNINVKGKL